MRATTVLFVALATAAFAGPANAIFKCTTAKGVVYQDRPCREGTENDVRITVPTGELAPKGISASDQGAGNPAHMEDHTQSVKPVHNDRDRPSSVVKRADERTEGGATDGNSHRKDAPATIDRTTPMTSDQARKTEPSAKYYATESFGAGSETPMQMNCESPSGEKRMFYLSNGKLTSI